MANVIDDTENLAVMAVGLLLLGAVVYILWQFRDFFGLGAQDAGTLQSLKNAGAGFPDGADPGTVPAAQYMQGVVESFNNFHDYVFGSPEDGSNSPAYVEPAPIDPAQVQQAVQNFSTTYEQLAQQSGVDWAVNNKLF